MYLWKVDSLVEDFKTEKVTQWEEFKYMLLYSVFTVNIFQSLYCIGVEEHYYDYISSALTLVVTIWGVYYCYKINKEGDNKDLFVRVMCIGLPVGIRISVFLMPILMFIRFQFLEAAFVAPVDNVATNEPKVYESTLFGAVFSVLFVITYYLYLSKKIRAVSS